MWNLSSLAGISGDFREQLKSCDTESIIQRLMAKSLEEMKPGDKFIKNNTCYVKKDNDVGIWALRYLSGERDCRYLPRYIGEESGVSKVAACRSRYDAIDFGELGRMLGEIHRLSSEKLGEARVFRYSRGMKGGFGTELGSHKAVIASWEICDVGDPTEDFILAFLNNTNPYGSSYDDIRRLTERKECSFGEFKLMLEEYSKEVLINRFGDKLNEAVDRMIKDATINISDETVSDIERLFALKAFLEIYRGRFNELTSVDCAEKCK